MENFLEKLSAMFCKNGRCIYNAEHSDGTTVTDEIITDFETDIHIENENLIMEYNEGQTVRIIPTSGLIPHFQRDEFGFTFSLFRNGNVEHQFTFLC